MKSELLKEDYERIFDHNDSMHCFIQMIEQKQKECDEKVLLDEYLDAVLDVNIVLDTGDGYSEFMMNTLSPSWGGRVYGYGYHIADEASIAWLTHQQGYSKRELNAYLHVIDEDEKRAWLKPGFLYSAAMEIWHELSDYNQVCFLVKMKFKDLLLLEALRKWGLETKKWNGYIILDKETRTGFYDQSSGSCSLLGIELEKNVKLPVKYIQMARPDCAYEWTLSDICENPRLWDNGGVNVIHMPKKFRRDLERLGFEKLWFDRNVSNYIVKTENNVI